MSKGKKIKAPLTTAQKLGSIIKSARDIMRKDKGLNGDLDRLPMLTWVMFLKFLDDVETIREETAVLENKPFRPMIETPYRWRDWAAADGLSGDDLRAFVNNDEAVRPDGKRAAGLLAYLRSLQSAEANGKRDPRDVIATVFKDVQNRMVSGYLLRELLDKINEIHFNSTEEMHTLSRLYESMLKEMRDAAGDSGEFYTPRAVVKFMVEILNPQVGEKVLDPACGTGGFLVEAYEHLYKQCQTVEDFRVLQEESIYGGEAKPLPYLLSQMNLLLHGLEVPNISFNNSLNVNIMQIGEADRVDVILTNPPFGGEEERGILSNFPDDKKTAETALLFMQLIMRKLRRRAKSGRAAVVVPDGMLFGDGVTARVKEDLLANFNLHTIVRLPNGVFAPYTAIKSNLLFFEAGEPTREIWFYEVPLPEGRKSYTKTAPMQFEDFAACLEWWNNRTENENAWLLPFDIIKKNALREAEPNWTAASEAEARAKDLAEKIKQTSEEIKPWSRPTIPLLQNSEEERARVSKLQRLETKLAELREREAAEREAQKLAQTAGDGIYWAIYNLDLKNPHRREENENQSPEKLVESILTKENCIAEIMTEIKELLAKTNERELEFSQAI
jgi:type I restriction enzyme M protein